MRTAAAGLHEAVTKESPGVLEQGRCLEKSFHIVWSNMRCLEKSF